MQFPQTRKELVESSSPHSPNSKSSDSLGFETAGTFILIHLQLSSPLASLQIAGISSI